MPLKKILFRPGVNRENTRYASESIGGSLPGVNVAGGWYESEKVRFRAGTPEKIGGWQRLSGSTFNGICRSLWNWVTLTGLNLLSVGTNTKYYIESGGLYYDITPIRETTAAGALTFSAVTVAPFSSTVTVNDTAHGCLPNDFVTISGAVSLGGNITAAVLNQEYQIVTTPTANSYTITAKDTSGVTVTSNASDTGSGGASAAGVYQINTGPSYQLPTLGWGSGSWSSGSWGTSGGGVSSLRVWNQTNFGDDLVFGYRGGPMYYWSAASGLATRGKLISSLGGTVTLTIASPCVITLTTPLTAGNEITLATTGALPTGLTAGTNYYLINVVGLTANLALSAGGTAITTTGSQSGVQSIASIVSVPIIQNYLYVSDTSRFVFAFGCNDYGSVTQNPMLIRWSSQESVTDWWPASTNQAGSVLLSHGSQIVTVVQTRQEIVVFTDSSLYSLQYIGPPVVWQSQLLGDNISIISQNAAVVASGKVYWMGVEKFYMYDGRIQTLNCDIRQYIFSDINLSQNQQVFAGTNEGFTEVWWFYCSQNSDAIDKYAIFNYGENIWYYGTMERTAWLDSGLRDHPVAATYINNLVSHEVGVDDAATDTTVPIVASITSAEFDIDDGHNFGFVWRVIPDLTFRGSTGVLTPQCTLTLLPLQNSGSGYTNPASVGGSSNATIQRIATAPIEEFTDQVYIRVRGRQMVFKLDSTQLGTTWQLGAPRIDIKTDGRRGNS
jgi:hypothetical protein